MSINSSGLTDLLAEICQNLPDYSQSLVCVSYKYEQCIYKFFDEETGERHTVDRAKLEDAAKALLENWPAWFPPMPTSLTDDSADLFCCNADADVVDYVIQLAIFKEQVYAL